MYHELTAPPVPAPDALLGFAARKLSFGTWSFQASMEITLSDELRALMEVAPGFAPGPQQVLRFFAADYQDRVLEAYVSALSAGTSFDLEVEATTGRGTRKWVRMAGEPVRDEDGRVVAVHGVLQDISHVRQLATENREAAARSRLHGLRLGATLNRLPNGFGTVGRDWRVTFVNSAGLALLGKTREELLQFDIWTLFPRLEELASGKAYRRAMDGDPQEVEDYYPTLGRWLRVRAFPIEDGLAICVTDVTEAHKAREEVLQLNRELERRVEERTAQLESATRDLESFAFMLAHDLKAPIAAVEGFSATLEEREPAMGDRSLHYLRRVRQAARQMGEMTDAILGLSRLSFVAVARENLDLSALATEVLRGLAESDPGRQVEWNVQPGLQARGDRALLRLVLQNLLSNAWKYSRPVEQARIEFGAQVAPEGQVFFVRDNGVGFDAAASRRLFQPFVRLHGSAFEGTGVGLANVDKIVKRHGGRLWAESAPAAGATFFFTLPAA